MNVRPVFHWKTPTNIDDVRESLRQGNVKAASLHDKVYTLTPVAM